MPTYEFKCLTCNITIEKADRVLPLCQLCGDTMNRVWDAPAIKFNGPGFYSTSG